MHAWVYIASCFKRSNRRRRRRQLRRRPGVGLQQIHDEKGRERRRRLLHQKIQVHQLGPQRRQYCLRVYSLYGHLRSFQSGRRSLAPQMGVPRRRHLSQFLAGWLPSRLRKPSRRQRREPEQQPRFGVPLFLLKAFFCGLYFFFQAVDSLWQLEKHCWL